MSSGVKVNNQRTLFVTILVRCLDSFKGAVQVEMFTVWNFAVCKFARFGHFHDVDIFAM